MLNNRYGYDFYFADSSRNILIEFPVTPAELNIKMGANNETVNLINDGDINILKSIQLTEIEFEATFPMKKYPYSRDVRPFQEYFNIFKDFLVNKKYFRFIVARAPWSESDVAKLRNMANSTLSKRINPNHISDTSGAIMSVGDRIAGRIGTTNLISGTDIVKEKSGKTGLLTGATKFPQEKTSNLSKYIAKSLVDAGRSKTSVVVASLSNGNLVNAGIGKKVSKQNLSSWANTGSSKNNLTSKERADNPTYWDVKDGDSVVIDGFYGYWDTNLPVSLESMEIKENADDGDDVVIEFKLKQYKGYGVKFLKTQAPKTTSTTEEKRDETKKTDTDQKYTIVAGDTLTIISKKFYGTDAYWKTIYDKNKDLIEKTAKDMGKSSSMGGNYIWAGVTLVIPAINK